MLHVFSLCALKYVLDQPEASWSSLQRQEVSWCIPLRPARGTACKGLCILAGRDWADFLETAVRADLIPCDPREDDPAAVRDGTGRTNLFEIPTF